MSLYTTTKVKKITPLTDKILVTEMDFNERFIKGGIILPGDNGKSEGIRPRWGKVFLVGPEQKDVKVGEYVLVKHGRWTRGHNFNIDGDDVIFRMIDNDDILLVSTKKQMDETFTTAETSTRDRNGADGSLHNC